jgi:putative membrane protein
MGVGMLVFWGLVVFAVVALLRWSNAGRQHADYSPQSPDAGRSTALQTLDERFARGDLTEDDYRRRRDVLTGR